MTVGQSAEPPLTVYGTARRRRPERRTPRPTAAAGVVLGIGTAVAGAAYVVVGAVQDAVGLAPAMAVTFALVLPAAVIAGRALRDIG
jgi:hypothetical protein